MSRLFPLRRSVEPTGEEPRLVDIDEDAADEVFGALSSETARSILAALYEEPRTASDLAEAVDTSLQNVRYHLEKLVDAELVEVADTWYSERGTEMKVYAPRSESLVLFAGSVAALLGFVHYATAGYLARQTDTAIANETAELANR